MAPAALFDFSQIDLDAAAFTTEQIESFNPHRGHMRMLDRIAWESDDRLRTVAIKDVRHDEFWVEGHIPGRPIFPGVLMIEAAAQLASLQSKRILGQLGFIGFAGVDKVKFRGQLTPGQRLVLLGVMSDVRVKRCIADVQGWVDGGLVFQGQVTGMPI